MIAVAMLAMAPISLVATGAALVCAAIALLATMASGAASRWAWAAASLGVLGLATAAASGSVHPLDLAALAGVVLVGGVAGAGWAPRGRTALLALGMLCFGAACVARLGTFSQIFAGHGSIDHLIWALARASGFVAFLAASGAVVLGSRRRSALPRGGLPARVYALHRALGLASVLALAVHLSSLWLDSFVQFAWGQLLVAPWTSGYRPFAVTLGWLAMVSLLLTAASGGLRRLLPGWRTVHVLAYLTFALGLVHGLMAGSDSGSGWALVFYGAALLAVAWTLTRRFKRPSVQYRGAREVARKESSAGAGWAHEGLGGTRVRTSYQSSPDAVRAYTRLREPSLSEEAHESRPGRPASGR